MDATGFEGDARRARFAGRGAATDPPLDGRDDDGAARFDMAIVDILAENNQFVYVFSLGCTFRILLGAMEDDR